MATFEITSCIHGYHHYQSALYKYQDSVNLSFVKRSQLTLLMRRYAVTVSSTRPLLCGSMCHLLVSMHYKGNGRE